MASLSRYNIALFDGLLNDNFDERAKVIRLINRWAKTCAKKCYPQQISDITTKNNKTSIPSPIFTDDSTSVASVSSYNASPNVKEDVPNHNVQQEENVKINANIIAEGNFKNYNDIIREKQVEEDEDHSIKDQKDMLRLSILTILRMTIDCPFQDVRRSFRKLLDKLKNIGVPVPLPIHPNPSFYIPSEDILTLEWPQTEYYSSATTSTPSFLKSPTSSITSSTASSSFDDGYLTRIDPPPNTPIVSTASVSTNNDSDKEAENNSSFLSSHLITSSIAVKQPDDLTRKLLVTTFVKIGRLSHFYRVLSYFPSFMEKFQRTYNEIIRNSTVLQKEWKFYIGIMAASQHKCQYLVSLLRNEYLIIGGDPKWLESLDNAPRKIRNLSALNTILAHQPWRLKPLDIARLIKGSKDRQDNWAITEIVHVILLLSTFHSMSSYVLGCGIVPEYDSIGGIYEDVSFNNADNVDGGNSDYKAIGLLGDIEEINPDVGAGLGVKLTTDDDSSIHSIKDIDDGDINNSNIGDSNNNDTSPQLSSTPKLCKFENCDEETFTSDSPNDPLPSSFFADQRPSSSSLSVHGHDFRNNTDSQFLPSLPSVPQLSNQHVEDFSRFADSSVEISYEDFNVNSDEYSVFKLQDYCWKDHGALMVNNFLPGLGDLLDDEFQEAKELNDYYSLFQSYTQQNNDLDVAPLRQAIWYYVQRLYGLSKDDYDYSDIRNLLNSKFKMFLKKVCCTPENLTINDWRNVGFQLRSEEKCHVNLIAIESRKQSELIYGLWCVMKCQNGKYDLQDDDQK
nr:5382_t:CDS:2 [Entrophospora candida]